MQKLKIKGKVFLGLYGGLGFFVHILYRLGEYQARKSAEMPVQYEFSLNESIILGIPFSIFIGLLIYAITERFERRSSDFGKNAIFCGVSNYITFFSINSVFFLLMIGALPGSVIIPFVFGGILGISSFLNIQFKEEPSRGLDARKLEHEELRLVVKLFAEITAIILTGAIIVSVIAVWKGYFPNIPSHILQIITLYFVIALYAIVGVFGIIAQIFKRMKKIRSKLGKSRKG